MESKKDIRSLIAKFNKSGSSSSASAAATAATTSPSTTNSNNNNVPPPVSSVTRSSAAATTPANTRVSIAKKLFSSSSSSNVNSNNKTNSNKNIGSKTSPTSATASPITATKSKSPLSSSSSSSKLTKNSVNNNNSNDNQKSMNHQSNSTHLPGTANGTAGIKDALQARDHSHSPQPIGKSNNNSSNNTSSLSPASATVSSTLKGESKQSPLGHVSSSLAVSPTNAKQSEAASKHTSMQNKTDKNTIPPLPSVPTLNVSSNQLNQNMINSHQSPPLTPIQIPKPLPPAVPAITVSSPSTAQSMMPETIKKDVESNKKTNSSRAASIGPPQHIPTMSQATDANVNSAVSSSLRRNTNPTTTMPSESTNTNITAVSRPSRNSQAAFESANTKKSTEESNSIAKNDEQEHPQPPVSPMITRSSLTSSSIRRESFQSGNKKYLVRSQSTNATIISSSLKPVDERVTIEERVAYSENDFDKAKSAEERRTSNANGEKKDERRKISMMKKMSGMFKFGSITSSSTSTAPDRIKSGSKNSAVLGFSVITIQGVSIKWFLSFIAKDKQISKKLSDGSVYTIKDFVSRVRELTKERKEAFADRLYRQYESMYVRDRADVIITHPWSRPLKDIVSALEILMKRSTDDEDIFMWFDAMVINQHRPEGKEFDTELWVPALPKTINDVGRLVVILSPVCDPLILTQTWGLWEIYSATQNSETKIDVIVLPDERDMLTSSIRDDLLGLMNKYSNSIDIIKSIASTEMEKRVIIDAAKQELGGIDMIHEKINAVIRNWLIYEAIQVCEDLEERFSNEEDVDLEELGFICNSIAELLGAQGNLIDQELYIRRALRLFIEINGNNHPDVAIGFNNLALLLQEQGKFDEAEDLFLQALDIDRAALGNLHPDVAGGLNNLATLYQEAGRYDEAEPLFRESISIFESILGPEHADVATAMNNLATLFKDKKDLAKAAEYYNKAYEIFKKVLGNDHPYTKVSEQYLHEVVQ